jgi:hypothetical protein
MAGERIGDVFIQVTTNAQKAAEDLRQAVQATEKLIEVETNHKELLDNLLKLEENKIKMSKRQVSQALGAARAQVEAVEEQIAKLVEMGAKDESQQKKQIKRLKYLQNVEKILNVEARNRIAAFNDYAGSQAEQRARRGEKVTKKELGNIQGFLSRASHEHGRFADRLDRRDMTRSIVENIRRGMEKGLLIGQRFHRDENALQRLARGFGIAGASIDRVKSSAERAANSFYKLQRIGYLLQTALSIVVASIGALVGGLMGLVGVAGVAASSLVALGGAAAGVGAGFMVASIAMKGIMGAVSQSTQAQTAYTRALAQARRELQGLKFDAEEAALSEMDAALNLERAREELARVQDLPPDSRLRRETELQYQQAELNYRRAKARNAESAKLAAGGVSGIMDRNNPGGMNQAMNLLTASQRKFAEYLISIKPKYRELKEAAADAFLGPLQQAVALVTNKMLPTLKNGMTVLGSAMGGAMKTIAEGFTNPENLVLLNKFFTDSVPSIKSFGDSVSAGFGGMLAVLSAAAPMTQRFSEWVTSTARGFESWAKSGLADGSLTKFFNLSGEVAARLGAVFGKVFDGIRNIINATFPGGDVNAGAGGVILQWLSKIAEGFKMFTGSTGFAQWLKTTTETATIAFSTIGQLLRILLDTADRPELKDFFLILRGAVDPLRKLFADGVGASPAFARLVVSVAKFFAILSDSVAISLFMDTLAAILESLTGILEVMKPFLDILGRFHAVILAVTAITFLFGKAGMVLFGVLEKSSIAVGGMGAAVFKASANMTALRSHFRTLRTEGNTFTQALVKTNQEMKRIVFSASASRNQEFLMQMSRSANLTTLELQQLNMELDKARLKGRTSLPGLTAGVRASGNAVAIGALDKSGIGNKLPGTGARIAAGGVGAALTMGIPQAIASAVGVPMQGAMSQLLGAVSMFTSFIPGLPGLIISGLAGLGSVVAGAIEGANITAQAELNRIKLIEANDMKAKLLTIEKTKEIGESFVAAGLSPRKAAEATERLRQEARNISGTQAAKDANLGASGIKSIIAELMSQGGADVTKALADPSSREAQNLIQSAINVAASGRTAQSAAIKTEEIASAVSIALSGSKGGAKKIGAFKTDEEGRITTGAAAQDVIGGQRRKAFEDELARQREGIARIKLEAGIAKRGTGTVDYYASLGGGTKPTEMTAPPLRISPKDNIVKIEDSSFTKTNGLLDTISKNTKPAPPPPAPIVNINIDKKFITDLGYKKTGAS